MSKFKLGDTVFSLEYGFGIVNNTNAISDKNYPIEVGYPGENIQTYTEEGKFLSSSFAPELLTLEEAAKLGYFPEKKKVKKTIDKWIILDLTSGEALELYNEIPNDWTVEDYVSSGCIVVKTTLEYEVEE